MKLPCKHCKKTHDEKHVCREKMQAELTIENILLYYFEPGQVVEAEDVPRAVKMLESYVDSELKNAGC